MCLPRRRGVCSSGVAMGCQVLRSEVFEPCHSHIPVQVFLVKCEEQACEESDVCELISAYARLCRQTGVCVDWRSPHLCRELGFFWFCFFLRACFSLQCTAQLNNVFTAMQCPSSMEYDACRTGCVDDCVSIQTLPGDWSVARGNESSCMDIPTEGCFCTGGTVLHHGRCLSPESCQQCVDQRGRTYTVGQHLCTVHSEAVYTLTS